MAFRFDGNEAALNCGSDSDIDNIWDGGATHMAWVYLDSFGGNGFGRVSDKDHGNGSGWLFFVHDGNDAIGFLHSYSFVDGYWRSATNSLQTGQWHHVAMTWDSSVASSAPVFYVDGVLSATTTISGQFGTVSSDVGEDLYIGNRDANDRTFDGLIADHRLYSSILDANAIATIFASRGRDRIANDLVRRFPLGPGKPGIAQATPYVGHTVQSLGSSSALTVNVPTEHQEGDLLVLVGFSGSNTSGTPANWSDISGWTKQTQLDLPSTFSTPSLQTWTKIASASEPGGGYSMQQNQSGPIIGIMLALRTNSSDQTASASTNTGTSTTPVIPSLTPGANSVLVRVLAHDNDDQALTPSWEMFAPNTRGVQVRSESGGGSNGGSLVVSLESWDDTASGTRTGSIGGSDQWGCITEAYDYGDGQEGLPAKDLSNAQAHGESYVNVVTDEDILTIFG